MIKELKYLFRFLFICLFIFFSIKFYISDINKKNSYRKIDSLDIKIIDYTDKLILLKDDTNYVVEYVKNNTDNKKKYYFWKLLDVND
jgi:hypothetical protein|tara:strand:+ start:367 stop:627 length:261 start_codon:yes stop_codon:yes gene_type:complete